MHEDRYHCKSMPPSCLLYPFNVLVVVFLCLTSTSRRISPKNIPVRKISSRHRKTNLVDTLTIIMSIIDFHLMNAKLTVMLRYRRRKGSDRNEVCQIGYRRVKGTKWFRRDTLSEKDHRRRFLQTDLYLRHARMIRRWFTTQKSKYCFFSLFKASYINVSF